MPSTRFRQSISLRLRALYVSHSEAVHPASSIRRSQAAQDFWSCRSPPHSPRWAAALREQWALCRRSSRLRGYILRGPWRTGWPAKKVTGRIKDAGDCAHSCPSTNLVTPGQTMCRPLFGKVTRPAYRDPVRMMAEASSSHSSSSASAPGSGAVPPKKCHVCK